MHVERVGTGRPLVVVHGWQLSGRVEMHDLEPIMSTRSGWRRLYVDLPGMGHSPADSRIRSQDDFLAVLQEFVRSEVPDGRMAIAGMSAGANLARGVAHRSAGRVRGLFIRVPMLVADDADRSSPQPLPDAVVAEALEQERQHKLDSLWAPAQRASDEAFLQSIREDPGRYAVSDPAPESMPFTGPTLIIAGRQDGWVGYREAIDLVHDYPRATLAVLDRAGHELPLPSQQALFAALVGEWLDRVEESWDAP